MTYDEATRVRAGDVLHSDWGDVGDVVAATNTGQSVVSVPWAPGLPAVRVHTAHAWRMADVMAGVEVVPSGVVGSPR